MYFSYLCNLKSLLSYLQLTKKTDTFFVIGITCDPYEIKLVIGIVLACVVVVWCVCVCVYVCTCVCTHVFQFLNVLLFAVLFYALIMWAGLSLCRCIHCKGLPYPPTYPRSVITSLPTHLLLCNPATEKTKFEVIIKHHSLTLCLTPYILHATGRVLDVSVVI